ncbi:MAG: aldehyde dehydrogenase family protein, partial [Flavobacteriales bacterium]|nr:aldehyde dehydrogenase family protein [Flavobacteriales bacterium]
MIDAIFTPPHPANEPVLSYAPGTPEREQVIHELERLLEQEKDLPMWIGAERVTTNDRRAVSPPHDHQHTIGHAHFGTADHVKRAIDAALAAKPAWEAMAWQDRAAIFLKAADLLSGPYRARMNAATMLAQSKNVFQAEIDAA